MRFGHQEHVIGLLVTVFANVTVDDLLARLASADIPAGKLCPIDEGHHGYSLASCQSNEAADRVA